MKTHLFHLKYFILYRRNISIISKTTITTSFLLDWRSIYVLHAMTYFNKYQELYQSSLFSKKK